MGKFTSFIFENVIAKLLNSVEPLPKLLVSDKLTSTNSVYKFWFKVENLKVLPGNYDVEVSSKKISHFVNSVLPIQYWIALEPESSYGE